MNEWMLTVKEELLLKAQIDFRIHNNTYLIIKTIGINLNKSNSEYCAEYS